MCIKFPKCLSVARKKQILLAARLKCKQKSRADGLNSDCESLIEKSTTGKVDFTTSFEGSRKLIADGRYGMASYVKGVSLSDPLSWTTSLCPESSLYIRAAVLLIKFSFFEVCDSGSINRFKDRYETK